MDLFSEIRNQGNPSTYPTPEPQPIVQPQPQPKASPSAISILHGFRKDAESSSRMSMKLFILFMFILIFDIASLVISYNTIGSSVVTDVAAAGMYGLVALTGYLLIEVRRAKKRVKEIDDFYMEYSIQKPQ